MMRVTSGLLALAVALVSVTAVIARTGESADADVTTMGATALRTSWYPNQSGLSPSLVGGGTFGQLFSANVVGQVYAQPLVSQGTLLVATEAGNVYGLDPASGAQRWACNLHTPWNPADLGCGDLTPTIGITGTPTIDPATNTAYLLAKTYRSGTSGPAAWWAHAIDVATGAERPGFPVLIQGLAANDPTHAFNATNQMQRPGLLLMDGVVYAGFGGHCDFGPYEGWVVGISTAGRITTLWTTEAHQGGSPGAGIWQSGGGLVSDGPGRIFLSTGNGNATNRPTPGASPPDALGAAVVRLAVQPDNSLRASDFFAPYDAQHLNEWDADVGSGAPVALPSEHFGTEAHRNLMVQVGKQGYVYVLDRDHLGGFAQGANGADAVVSRIGPYGGVWSKPAVWPGDGGYVYVATASGGHSASGTSGYLRAYKYGVDGSGTPVLGLVASSADAFGFSSGPPAVTSDGTASGTALLWIVWSPDGSGNGAQLRAYDAVPVDGAFALRFSAPIGQAAKFSSPGIDANRVYVGTRDGRLLGFGVPVDAPLSAQRSDRDHTVDDRVRRGGRRFERHGGPDRDARPAPRSRSSVPGSSAHVDLDPARLGVLGLGDAQLEHSVPERRVALRGIQLPAQGEQPPEAQRLDLRVGGGRALRCLQDNLAFDEQAVTVRAHREPVLGHAGQIRKQRDPGLVFEHVHRRHHRRAVPFLRPLYNFSLLAHDSFLQRKLMTRLT